MYTNLERWLVGGFVRDSMIGIQNMDRDYVVVNETIESMIKRGFKHVSGNCNVPVFHDPNDFLKTDYALARLETSVNDKHNGFTYNTDGITLKEDLYRRDFTINAMAIKSEADGEPLLIDYFNGCIDIRDRIIRMVDENTFKEDPLRVLRAARFAARLDFTVEANTIKTCREMCENGMLNNLPYERITKELRKAMGECEQPSIYFQWLLKLGALEYIYPEIYKMFTVQENEEYHPEKTTFNHTMLALDAVNKLVEEYDVHDKNIIIDIKIATLFHDVGKTLTKVYDYPKHNNHDDFKAIELMNNISNRMKFHKKLKLLAVMVVENHMKFTRIEEMRANSIRKVLKKGNIGNNGDCVRFNSWLLVCLADKHGRCKSLKVDTVKLGELFDRWSHIATAFKDYTYSKNNTIDLSLYKPKAIKQITLQGEIRYIKKHLKNFLT